MTLVLSSLFWAIITSTYFLPWFYRKKTGTRPLLTYPFKSKHLFFLETRRHSYRISETEWHAETDLKKISLLWSLPFKLAWLSFPKACHIRWTSEASQEYGDAWYDTCFPSPITRPNDPLPDQMQITLSRQSVFGVRLPRFASLVQFFYLAGYLT